MKLTRAQVLAFRVATQQLHHGPQGATGPAVLDVGVQDTGADGAGWALANRGVAIEEVRELPDSLALVWTIRGAPHCYRRAELAEVAAATWPWSDADAAKRIFDAARPLRSAGIPARQGLERMAEHLASVVTAPMVKGEVSAAVTARAEPHFLRWCVPCQATHSYEQTFRMAALHAGLELQPHTSPPVLRPVPSWQGPAPAARPALDPVRAVLHFLGPLTPKQVAAYVDSPVAEVRTRWPDDAVQVEVVGEGADGEARWLLEDDVETARTADVADEVRLLGSHDLFLQARDRELLVPDATARKEQWRVLGRPGAVLRGAELVGTWRARTGGGKLAVETSLRARCPEDALGEQAERLADFRGLRLA